MISRIQSFLWLAFLFSHASAVTLLQVIQSRPELTTLAKYINATSDLTNFLAKADNFTFLAPSNDAIGKFLSGNPNILTPGLLEATIQYSLLQGTWPKLSFNTTSQFASTNLYNGTYTNVTSSQHVELVLSSQGTPQAISGNKSVSTATTTDLFCTGGIIHVMDGVQNIPLPAVTEITNAGLEYGISILSSGGFLSAGNANYVNTVLELRNLTYFIPNTAQALADAKALTANTSAAELQALYQLHIVPDFVGYSTNLTNGTTVKSIQGGELKFTVQDGDIYVNAARIITPDYLVANGVFHVIDNVIRNNTTPVIAPKASAAPNPSSTAGAGSPSTQAPEAGSSPKSAPAKSPSSPSLDTKSLVGIAVGSSVGGIALLAALVFFLLRMRKSKDQGTSGSSGAWSVSGPSSPGATYAEKGSFYPVRPYRESPVPPPEPYMPAPLRSATTPEVPHRSPRRLDDQEFF